MPAMQSNNLPASSDQITSGYENGLRAFTFWISDTLYAIDIAKVLTISQETSHIQSLPAQAKGLVGMVEFQGNAIPVLDFANMLGFPSGIEKNSKLIDLLSEKEKDHIEWVTALEDCLTHNTSFTKPKDPHKCAFGKWYDNYTCRDDTFMELLSEFDTPHKKIHALADKLILMEKDEGIDKALKALKLERRLTLTRLLKRFEQARAHLRESSRQVLLYITENGKTPIVALRIDDINDVIDFKSEQFKPMDRINNILNESASELIIAYLKQKDLADCLLIETSNLEKVAKI